jgi:hypothetical protein
MLTHIWRDWWSSQRNALKCLSFQWISSVVRRLELSFLWRCISWNDEVLPWWTQRLTSSCWSQWWAALRLDKIFWIIIPLNSILIFSINNWSSFIHFDSPGWGELAAVATSAVWLVILIGVFVSSMVIGDSVQLVIWNSSFILQTHDISWLLFMLVIKCIKNQSLLRICVSRPSVCNCGTSYRWCKRAPSWSLSSVCQHRVLRFWWPLKSIWDARARQMCIWIWSSIWYDLLRVNSLSVPLVSAQKILFENWNPLLTTLNSLQ